MKTINLNKYYRNPELYGESNIIVVTDEVADMMDSFVKEEKNSFMRRYRAKAYYSLDYGNEIDHYVIFREGSPEELYEKKLTIQQLNYAISRLPIKEGQHIYARYFLGKSCKEIATAEKISTRAVQKSLRCGLKKLGKFLKKTF
ncbi:MAG: RNA polymerase sigma factor [Gemmiger sp.]